MCTSDTRTDDYKNIKTALIYVAVTILCALFGAVYEIFSHEVYSYFMIYAFTFPLISAGIFLAIALKPVKRPGTFSCNMYHSGIAALTVGSIVRGVLDIYGTTNQLINIYWILGALLVIVGAVFYCIRIKSSK